MCQFENHLRNLQKLSASYCEEDLDSKVIIKRLLESSKFYKGTEMVLQAISVCAVKFSVESVLESLISVYKHHYRDDRKLNEESAAEEFQIAINGPSLARYDDVVHSAMSQYWSSKSNASWNFTRSHLYSGEFSTVIK